MTRGPKRQLPLCFRWLCPHVQACGQNGTALAVSAAVPSLQAPTKHQQTVAHVLGLPHHKVVCHVKRLGGGFGGKESRSAHFNACAAVPAWHTRKAVRLCLDRDEDMQLSGHRHAFLGRYKVGTEARPSQATKS